MQLFEDIFQFVFTYYYVFAFVCLILYLPRIRYYLDGFRKQKRLINKKINKFVLLIPARDESLVIRDLFETINNQDYDLDNISINLIVDDEEDPSIEIIKEYFTNYHIRVIKDQTCKGEALDGAIKEIIKEEQYTDYAGYLIVDADNLLSPDFFTEINNSLLLDKQIVIASKLIKNLEFSNKKVRTIVSNCSGQIFTYLDKLGNKFRTKREIPCSITGTGLFIRNDLIKELNGWPYKTLTEDFELMMDCIIKGYSSAFYEHAIVYVEEPITHKESMKRRVRWLTGYSQCRKKYIKEVKKSKKSFDFLYSLYPVYIYYGVSVALLIISLVMTVLNIVYSFSDYNYFNHFINIIIVSYSSLMFYTIIGLAVDIKYSKLNVIEKILVTLFNPLFLAEYIYIMILAQFKKRNPKWVQTKRFGNFRGSDEEAPD